MPAPLRSFLSAHAPLLVLLLLFALWCTWFIFRTSFVLDGERYFCLYDDPMVSMAYARNLVEGHGLNWARWGDPVEGFTCPLWTFYMALLHLLPLPLRLQSLLVQVTGLLLLVANVALVYQLVRRHFSAKNASHALPAAVLTATYYPLNHWGLRGMESGLQVLLVTLSVSLALDIAFENKRRELALFGVLTASALLRMDMLVSVVVVLAFLAFRGSLPWSQIRRWGPGAALLFGACAAYQAFRLSYFHDWLPNTYYLKMTGVPGAVRIVRGLAMFIDVAKLSALPLLAVYVGVVPFLRARPKLVLPLALVTLQFAYSIYAGGDVWEVNNTSFTANRFQLIVMPLVFVMLNALANLGLDAWHRRRGGGAPAFVSDFHVLAVLTIVCGLQVNGLWKGEKAGGRWHDVLITTQPFQVEDHKQRIAGVLELSKTISNEAKLAVLWAGVPAYFSDFRMVDILGYNDRYTAHLQDAPPQELDRALEFFPGHNKRDYQHTFGRLRPDVVYEPWLVTDEGFGRMMNKRGFVLRLGAWIRRDSTYANN